MKLVVLIADGMGGWPVEALGGRTALQAAVTPVMDRLARQGLVGLCRTVPEGMPPGSDVANMALLGFDPGRHHTGRGPIEAAAMGLELGRDDVVFRMNLVDLTGLGPDGIMRDYSAGHIGTEAARRIVRELEALLPDGFALHPGVQYRHLLVVKGGAGGVEEGLAARPPHDITDKGIGPDIEEFRKSPRMWEFVRRAGEFLARGGHGTRAASVWPWGQGRALSLPDFHRAAGLRGAVVSAVDLVRGLGRAAGMEVLDVPGATGLLDTNYEGKVRAALDFLDRGDFVFVHLEGPDECGHGGDVAGKVEAIARFDARVVAPMVEALGDRAAVLVACDHLTPLAVRTHVPDPVPFVLWARGLVANGAAVFDEPAAAATGLVVDPGHGLLAFALGRVREASRR